MERVNITGIGIEVTQLSSVIDTKKFLELYEKEFSKKIEPENFNLNDYVGQLNGFLDIGEAFYYCDDSDLLSWMNNNEGEVYLLYQPRFLWEYGENAPKSVEEVETLFINTIKKLVNLTDDEIKKLIDYRINETYLC